MRLVLFGLALACVAIVAGAAVFLAWDIDWRWRPHTLAKHPDEIIRTLEGAGWVSPHLTGPRLYALVYRDCAACGRVESQLLPKLQAADVDTRMIVVARPASTPIERATVAELWVNRSWRLFQQWLLVSPTAWNGPGVPPADGDAARTAVIDAGRKTADEVARALASNGFAFDYPTLIWQAKDGRLRACVCRDPRSYRFVEEELTD
jgi:hypothetical protein